MLDPQSIVQKQITNASNAVETLVAGIQRMTETPGAAAVRAKEKYRQAVLAALDNGTFDAGQQSYTLQQYQDVAIPKIRERYASGMAASQAKSLAARIQLNAWQETIRKAVAAMPNITAAQREARMLYNLRQMRLFRLQSGRR
jgi:hypothetical protein